MGWSVVLVPNGGIPVVGGSSGIPMDVAPDRFGNAVTIAANGFGIAVNFNDPSSVPLRSDTTAITADITVFTADYAR